MAKNLKWYHKNSLWRRLRVRRKYKDQLFRFLFRDKKDLLALYNAVNDSSYKNPEDLEIITLEDVIFMKLKNDLSFMIANKMNLYEHQSTYSPNMPIRGLIYFARQYEGLIAEKKLNVYGTKLVELPTPKYVIFYNGSKEQPDRTELFLSDAFASGRGSGCLECRALLLNINRGHNKELMEKCRRLWEYSEFIAEVNECLAKNYPLKKAIHKAMESCIEKDILRDVLIKSKAEVLNMLLTEYDEKEHMKATYKEGYEDGEQAGYSKGEQDGRNELIIELIQKKHAKGKSIEQIAEELEEDMETIEMLVKEIERI